jgi:hypothetical protein
MFTKRGRFSGPFIFGAVYMPPVRLPALDSHAPYHQSARPEARVGQRRHQPPAPDATDLGYLVSRETGRGRPARTVLGDPTPEMLELLPERVNWLWPD